MQAETKYLREEVGKINCDKSDDTSNAETALKAELACVKKKVDTNEHKLVGLIAASHDKIYKRKKKSGLKCEH